MYMSVLRWVSIHPEVGSLRIISCTPTAPVPQHASHRAAYGYMTYADIVGSFGNEDHISGRYVIKIGIHPNMV